MGLRIIYGISRELPVGILILPDDESIRAAVLRETGCDGAILGTRTFSLYSFAKDIASEIEMPEAIDEVDKLMLIRRLMREIPALSGGSGMISYAANLGSLLTSLRSNGIYSSEELLDSLDNQNARLLLLGELLDAYSRALDDRNQIDEPSRFARIIELLENGGPIQKLADIERISVIGFDEIDRVVAEFYCALSRHVQFDFYSPLPDDNPYGPKRTAAANAPAQVIIDMAKSKGIEVRFDSIPRMDSPGDDIIHALAGKAASLGEIPKSPIADWPKLTSLTGRNPSEQAEVIASAAKYLILEHGLSYEDITIYAKDATDSDIRRALDQHDLPYFHRQEKALSETGTVELLKRFFAFIRSGFGREELRRLLTHRFIDHKKAAKFDSIAIEQAIIGGLPAQKNWLRLLEGSDREDARELGEMISGFIEITGGKSWSQKISGEEFIQIIDRFIDEFDIADSIVKHITNSRANIIALEAEIAAFGKIFALKDVFGSVPTDSFKNHVEFMLYLYDKDSAAGHGGTGIRILSPDEIPQTDSRVVIVADVVQGEFPPPAPSYPFLKLSDAEKIGLVLPEFAYRKDYEFLTALERSELVVLTRPLAEGDSPKPPAPILIALQRALGRGLPDYEQQMESIAGMLTSLPYSNKRVQIMAGEILPRHFESGERPAPALLSADGIDKASRALHVEKRFRSAIGHEYSGSLSEPFRPGFKNRFNAISVTDIENYARCPFMFFASKALRIEPLGDVEEGIPAIVAGNILHVALEQFYREGIETIFERGSEIPDRVQILTDEFDRISPRICVTSDNLDHAHARLNEITKEKLITYQTVCPSRLAFDSMEYLLIRSLNAYLESVVDLIEFVPIAVELDFAGEIAGSKVYGKADRIDCNRDGKLRIIDYKWGYGSTGGRILKTEALQLPLYVILSGLPGVASIGYIAEFKKQAPNLSCGISFVDTTFGKVIDRESWNELLENVHAEAEIIIEKIQGGDFPPLPRGTSCPQYCPFAGICGYEDLVTFPEEFE